MRAAPGVLHAFTPESVAAHSGSLRGQPLVRKALQLTQLVVDAGAAGGRSPSVGAGGSGPHQRRGWVLEGNGAASQLGVSDA